MRHQPITFITCAVLTVTASLGLAPIAAGASTGAGVTAAPAAPASVVARPVGHGTLDLSWPQVPGADEYEIVARDVATGAVIGPVHAAGVRGEIGGLTIGRAYAPGVRAASTTGSSPTMWGQAATVLADGPPAPVRSVRATASRGTTQVAVSWAPASGGIQPDAYAIEFTRTGGALVGTYSMCDHPCSSRGVGGLEPGIYRVRVTAMSWAGGPAPWAAAMGTVTVVDGCAAGGACLTVAAGADQGPATLRAQGINAGLEGFDPARLDDLHLRHIRSSSMVGYELAQRYGADFTWVLSNNWYDVTRGTAGTALFPWANWAFYASWVTTAAGAFRAFAPVDYLDVQNEPYLGYFTSPGTNWEYPPALLADQFDVAVDAARAGDPDVRVVGPSFSTYLDSQMRTFLDDAVERDVRLDAIAWHELTASGASVTQSPTDLVEHVARVRALLRERPTLGDPEIHINEYAGYHTHLLPGWGAGYIAALETANVDLSMRTCWTSDECAAAGGLLDPATGATRAPYWVHRYYAEQTGRRVPVVSTNANVSAFATRDGNTVKLLVGRHQTCVQAVNPNCNQPSATTTPPFAVPVTVTGLPARASMRVVMSRVPATSGNVPAPITMSSTTVRVPTNGSLVVSLPTVADGEAWTVTIEPAT